MAVLSAHKNDGFGNMALHNTLYAYELFDRTLKRWPRRYLVRRNPRKLELLLDASPETDLRLSKLERKLRLARMLDRMPSAADVALERERDLAACTLFDPERLMERKGMQRASSSTTPHSFDISVPNWMDASWIQRLNHANSVDAAQARSVN